VKVEANPEDGFQRDPACCSFGAGGSDEVVVVPWPVLLRRRVAERATRSPRYRWWVLVSVLAGLFSINVTFTILAVALPRIARELHSSVNTLTWVITGPLLAFGVVAPTFGKSGDIWGHRRLYLWGLAGGFSCALLSAAAPNAGFLIAVRTLEGLEGAATGTASMAIICQVFAPGDRVKAMGWWSLVGAGGPVLGVTLGGPLIERYGWRALFVAQAPLSLAALVVTFAILPETGRGARQRLDWPGALALTAAAVGLLFGLNRGTVLGWTSPVVVAAFLFTPLGAALFVFIERRSPAPLLPLRFLRRRNFVFPIGAQVFGNFAYMGGFILAPLLLEQVFGYSESRAGLEVIARPIAFSITAPIAGYLAVRIGERISAFVGALAVAASMMVFASVGRGSPDLVLITALVLSGIGLGVSSPSVAASVANSVDQDSLGIASAVQQLVTNVGVAAGIQVMETVQAARLHAAGLLGSFADSYRVGAVVAALAMLCALGMHGGRSAERPELALERAG
jgi:EmrB/QacA subfamily drug resistance transporter